MAKLKILILFLAVGLMSTLSAFETKKSSLYYVKLGATHPPTDFSVLPMVGVGARFQRDEYGLDLSANVGSIIFNNYVALKGVFLFYPYYEKKNQFYVGVGPGVGHYENSVVIGEHFGVKSHECRFLTIEGVVGYEFRHARYFKTFIQIELSQPAVILKGNVRHHRYKPGVACNAGVGF